MGVPVPNYPDYEVEPTGEIFSKRSNKYLIHNVGKSGYHTVELFNKNGHKRILVHRLVAMAFIPNPENYPQVNHKDENKANNDATNLEWCTAKYNMNYGEAAKTRHSKIDYSKPIYRHNAIKNGRKVARAIVQFTKDGIYITKFDAIIDASKKLDIDAAHISECAKGKRSTAGGYVWKYERSDDLSVFQY